MCDTCGCGNPAKEVTIKKPGEESENRHDQSYQHDHAHSHDGMEHEHTHSHNHSHTGDHSHDHAGNHIHHDHQHDHSHPAQIDIGKDILHKNNLLAERNRGFFQAKKITALNLVSSPGSGKTSLLERTIREVGKELDFFIIEGDQQTMQDAYRIKASGAPVVQVNTGDGCHLDSDMVRKACEKLELRDHSVLMIENVGNLVCPALFDLGESKRVVIISVTEGDDKPLKYPNMFHYSDLCIINKTDLLPYVDFEMDRTKDFALKVNPGLEFIELSVKSGSGIDVWYQWLKGIHQLH